nr:MerR family DNA-binding protein [Halioglobus sp.]
NFRLYDGASAEQLVFIKLCRGLDLSLSEIRQLLILKRSPNAQCDDVNRMIEVHIQQVESRIRELTQLNEMLKALRGRCSDQRTVEQCGILQTLSSNQI